MDRISADAVLAFEKIRVFIGAFLFQKLLINAEFSNCAVPYQNSVNIFLRNGKSGGPFILRFFDSLPLFFFRGKRGA